VEWSGGRRRSEGSGADGGIEGIEGGLLATIIDGGWVAVHGREVVEEPLERRDWRGMIV
jgi:hypothetical protein